MRVVVRLRTRPAVDEHASVHPADENRLSVPDVIQGHIEHIAQELRPVPSVQGFGVQIRMCHQDRIDGQNPPSTG